MAEEISQGHFRDTVGDMTRGVYEQGGWWWWYKTAKKRVKRGNFHVEVDCVIAEGGPWPNKQSAVDEMRGIRIQERKTA